MPVVKFDLDSFEQGGLLNDVDVEFTNCRFEMFDYKGKADPIVAFASDLKQDNGDVSEQYWSCGGKDSDMKPSDDGQTIESESGTTLKKGSMFHALIAEMTKFGVDPKLFVKAGNINGLRAHMVRRKIGTTRSDGSDNQVLLPTEILKGKGKATSTGATASAKSTAGTAAAPAATAAAAPSGDVAAEATTVLTTIAGEVKEGESFDLKKLKLLATKRLLKNSNRAAIIETLMNSEWLGENAEKAGFLFADDLLHKVE